MDKAIDPQSHPEAHCHIHITQYNDTKKKSQYKITFSSFRKQQHEEILSMSIKQMDLHLFSAEINETRLMKHDYKTAPQNSVDAES